MNKSKNLSAWKKIFREIRLFLRFCFMGVPLRAREGSPYGVAIMILYIFWGLVIGGAVYSDVNNPRIEWKDIQGTYQINQSVIDVTDQVVTQFISEQRFFRDVSWKKSYHVSNFNEMIGDISGSFVIRYTLSPRNDVFYELDILCYSISLKEMNCQTKKVK